MSAIAMKFDNTLGALLLGGLVAMAWDPLNLYNQCTNAQYIFADYGV